MIQFTVQGGDSVLYGSQVRNNIFRRPRLQYNCLQTFQGRSCQQIFLFVLDKKNSKSYFWSFQAYSQSKLANILFTKELARREKEAESNVTANCLHPGVVKTELTRHKNGSWSAAAANLIYAILSPALKSPRAGAQTSIFCAVDESLKDVSGVYFVDCHEGKVAKQGEDMEAAARLWTQSDKIVSQ